MGYYASGDGIIEFKRQLKTQEMNIIEKALKEAWFEFDFWHNQQTTFLMISMSDNYHEDIVMCALDIVAKTAPIDSGYINLVGEDDYHWRLIYKDGIWIDQPGTISYIDKNRIDCNSSKTERRSIWVKPSTFSPEFEAIISVPVWADAVEYIDELLDGLLSEEFKNNIEWDFVDGIS